MASVKTNVIANYLGGIWNALMGLAFVPLYIHYLGVESYGLIGVFVSMQAWLVLLDMGLAPALGREMARFGANVDSAERMRDLLRSVETIYFALAVVIALGGIFGAPWLAKNWLRVEHLPLTAVEETLAIVGGVITLRWLAILYRSAMTGLERFVWLSSFSAMFSTLRGLGVVAVIAWVSPTIRAFFIYQAVIAAVEVAVLATQVWRVMPTAARGARFSLGALKGIRHFASGMMVIALLTLLLTQVDKVLLSRLLTLSEFGYYMLASSVAAALYLIVAPISTTALPRLTQLATMGDVSVLAASYHRFSQLLALLLVPVALTLSLFSHHILLLWTRDQATASETAPILSVLVIGTLLNGLMHLPYHLQLAHGWTRLTIVMNALSVMLLAPAIYWGVSLYGAVGAAIAWCALNVGYLLIFVPLTHRYFLKQEKWRWYLEDILAPAAGAFATLATVRLFAPAPDLANLAGTASVVFAAGVMAFATAAICSPVVRRKYFHV